MARQWSKQHNRGWVMMSNQRSQSVIEPLSIGFVKAITNEEDSLDRSIVLPAAGRPQYSNAVVIDLWQCELIRALSMNAVNRSRWETNDDLFEIAVDRPLIMVAER